MDKRTNIQKDHIVCFMLPIQTDAHTCTLWVFCAYAYFHKGARYLYKKSKLIKNEHVRYTFESYEVNKI
jgi:hypothetical protein